MSKILAIGGVLPEFAREKRLVAMSYRMEQLVEPLVRDGHRMIVCGQNPYDPVDVIKVSERKGLLHYQIDCEEKKFLKKVQLIHDQFRPDCVIGVGRVNAILTAKLKIKVPIWIDLFGSAMCEAQSKAFIFDDDHWVKDFWIKDEPFIERADIFSTCGHFQEHFLTGLLSALGRLSKNTYGYRFVYAIPPGISHSDKIHKGRERLLRGNCLAEEDFVVLWCGGYNVWTDVDVLFSGLEKAFAADNRIKFVSLGGRIEDHDNRTYPRFQRMIAESKYRDRFKLLGWRSHADALRAYSECDLGISIDRYHYEPVYGTRTRLIEMIQNRLPVITTLACELSHVLKDNALALTFSPGDSSGLAENILNFSREPEVTRKALADRAYAFFEKNFSYEKTTEPLRAWVRNPTTAPDRDLEERLLLPLRSNRDYWRRFFEEKPEHNIALKRLMGNKIKAKFRKLFRREG